MFRSFIAIMALSCCISAGVAQGKGSAELSAWYVDSLVKVFPNDAPLAHALRSPEFTGARNQHLSVLLAIRSSRPLPALTAEVKPLEGGAGRSIASVEVHHVAYVVVGSHPPDSPPDELVGTAPGWYPDPLEDFPFDLEARRTTPIWVTIAIPPDAAPGVYEGSIALRSGDRLLARRPFRLRVLKALVPAEMSLKVTNWFTLDDKTSQQFFGVAAYSPQWWTLVSNVAHVLAEHRQNVIITPLLTLIQPRLAGGNLQYDFTNFDRWVETFQQAGAIGYIEGSHLLDRAGSYDASLVVSSFQVIDGKPQRVSLPPDDPRVEPAVSAFLAALGTHLKEKGWDTRYFQHVLDEAHGNEPPYYGRFAALVHQQMPGIPTLDAIDAENLPEVLQKNCDVLGSATGAVRRPDAAAQAAHRRWPRRLVLHLSLSSEAAPQPPDGLALDQSEASPVARFPLRLYGVSALGRGLLDSQAAARHPTGDRRQRGTAAFGRCLHRLSGPRAPYCPKFDSIRSDAREHRRL